MKWGYEFLMLPKFALCGCVTDAPVEKLGVVLQHSEVDLMEWRLDVFFRRYGLNETLDALGALSTAPRHPVLATNRHQAEGGMFEGTEELRLEILHRAIDAGVEWIDVEERIADAALQGFLSRNVRVLLSHHDVSATPDRSSLKRLAKSMARRGVHGIKIVTFARTPEDNLSVLGLIPFGRQELGVDVVAFCMGPQGRWSRAACLFLGSPWTYVQVPDLSPAAEGQFTAAEMRLVLNRLGAVN
jgi:3-dehydroquinate dehydratase type I